MINISEISNAHKCAIRKIYPIIYEKKSSIENEQIDLDDILTLEMQITTLESDKKQLKRQNNCQQNLMTIKSLYKKIILVNSDCKNLIINIETNILNIIKFDNLEIILKIPKIISYSHHQKDFNLTIQNLNEDSVEIEILENIAQEFQSCIDELQGIIDQNDNLISNFTLYIEDCVNDFFNTHQNNNITKLDESFFYIQFFGVDNVLINEDFEFRIKQDPANELNIINENITSFKNEYEQLKYITFKKLFKQQEIVNPKDINEKIKLIKCRVNPWVEDVIRNLFNLISSYCEQQKISQDGIDMCVKNITLYAKVVSKNFLIPWDDGIFGVIKELIYQLVLKTFYDERLFDALTINDQNGIDFENDVMKIKEFYTSLFSIEQDEEQILEYLELVLLKCEQQFIFELKDHPDSFDQLNDQMQKDKYQLPKILVQNSDKLIQIYKFLKSIVQIDAYERIQKFSQCFEQQLINIDNQFKSLDNQKNQHQNIVMQIINMCIQLKSEFKFEFNDNLRSLVELIQKYAKDINIKLNKSLLEQLNKFLPNWIENLQHLQTYDDEFVEYKIEEMRSKVSKITVDIKMQDRERRNKVITLVFDLIFEYLVTKTSKLTKIDGMSISRLRVIQQSVKDMYFDCIELEKNGLMEKKNFIHKQSKHFDCFEAVIDVIKYDCKDQSELDNQKQQDENSKTNTVLILNLMKKFN